MTLWGKQAEQYNDSEKTPVIAFKGVKVGEYQGMFTPRMLCNRSKVFDAGGRTLSMYSSSTMQVNPEIDECFALRGWYDSAGADQTFKAHSSTSAGGFSSGFNRAEVRGLDEVKQAGYGMPGNPEYFSARGTVMHIKSEPISYPACPNEGCNKKVEEVGDSWRCEKCNQNFSEPQHRYIMSMAVADYSGQAWLQGFNDVGEAVFGMTANELLAIKVSVICFACCATPHLIYMIGSQPRRIHSGNGKVLGVYVQFFLQSQAGYLEGEYFPYSRKHLVPTTCRILPAYAMESLASHLWITRKRRMSCETCCTPLGQGRPWFLRADGSFSFSVYFWPVLMYNTSQSD